MVNGKMSKIKSKLNCFVAVVRRCCSFFTRMLFELSRASFVGNLIINQQAKPKWTVPKKRNSRPTHHTHTHTQLARAQSEAFYFVPIKWVIAADDPLKTQAICGYWRSEREGDAQSEWERERELKRVNEAEPAALIPNWKLAGSLHWLWSVVLFLLLRSDKLWKCVADNTMWWRGTY